MSQAKKVAVITGANKGLGKEIARQLGKLGFTVVVGSRDEAAGRVAVDDLKKDGVDAVAVRLEVTNPDHVASAAKFVADRFGKVDVLVNNAGISLDWDGSAMTADKLRKTYEANAIAPFVVSEAFLPLLAKSDDARLINHSSILGSIGSFEKQWANMEGFATEAYAMSKAAMNMLTVIQSGKLKGKGIAVAAAHPGWVQTDLGGEGAPLDVVTGAKTVVGLATMPRAQFPHASLTHLGERLPW